MKSLAIALLLCVACTKTKAPDTIATPKHAGLQIQLATIYVDDQE